MKNLVLVAVVIGLMLGAFGAVLATRRLISFANRHFRLSVKGARLGAIAGGALALLPSFLLAIDLGGSLGRDVFPGDAGLLLGATGGMGIVFGLGLACGAAVGVLVAAAIARLFGRANRTARRSAN